MARTVGVITGQNIPLGYFDNVDDIQARVTRILNLNFDIPIVPDYDSVKRIMIRTLEERLEPKELMDQRTIMTLVDEIKNHFLERNKNLMWERVYTNTTSIYDSSVGSGPDTSCLKFSRAPSTLRFYNTFGT